MSIASGSYEILPLLDVTMALDVSNNSVANKANVQVWGRNGSNAQKWTLTSQSGYWTIIDAETGKSLDVAGGTQAKGTNVQLYTSNGSTAQRWAITETGTQAVNGTSYPVVSIGAFGASTYVLDVAGGKTDLKTNIQIWTSNGSAAQRFVLVPTEWLATLAAKTDTDHSLMVLPTPSSGSCGTTVGTVKTGAVAIGSGTVYPCWVGRATTVQLRYRTRRRTAGGAMGAWSNWKSIADGATTWDGWGTPGQSNCTATASGGRLWSSNGVAVDNSSTYDRTDVEFSVREWTSGWMSGAAAHGDALTWTVVTARAVSISDIDMAIAPDGLAVSWTSNATTSGNAIVAKAAPFDTLNTTGAAAGSSIVPMWQLVKSVASGDSVKLTVTLTTPDGITASRTETITLSYESGHSSGLTLSATVSGTTATVTASNAAARLWLVIPRGHGTRFVEVVGSSPWVIAPPLGVQWKLYAATSAGTWSSVVQTFNAIHDSGYHVTSQDLSRDLAVYHNTGEPPEFSPSFSRSTSSHEVLGRERQLNSLGPSTTASWTLKGVLHGQTLDSGIELADWAAHAGHVYFRGPNGFWAQALVTGAEVDLSKHAIGIASVSISFDEEVW